MNGRERMAVAMRLGEPDRVPVMCQLALGHYFLHVDRPNEEIWFDAECFSDALITMARRYSFDGVLVNLLAQAPDWRDSVDHIDEKADGTRTVCWKGGGYCIVPPDDNLHHYPKYVPPDIADVDPAEIWYDDPHGIGGLKYPFYFGLDPAGRGAEPYFPDCAFRTIDLLKEKIGGELSIHGECFSPFTQLLELFTYSNALMYLMTDADKCHAILARYAEGTAELAGKLAERGVDAVLVSSAFAGAGFISRDFYRTFVHPYEKRVVEAVKAARVDLPVYVHTCGAIGDRLELMLESGFDGVDTLDPPPLGTVELQEAVPILKGRAFIKGNMDPVGTMLNGSPEIVYEDAKRRLEIAGPGGGYILSTACSVPPHTPPENLATLIGAAEKYGRFA